MKAKRRRWWWKAGAWVSIFLGFVNLGLFYAGVMSEPQMNSVTNWLSWLAITFTFSAGHEAATPNEEA